MNIALQIICTDQKAILIVFYSVL